MKKFFEKLLNPLKDYADGEANINAVRESLLIINQYFYNTYHDIGKICLEDLDYETEYFSEFHKLWCRKSEEILSPSIVEKRCEEAADVLNNVRTDFGDAPFQISTNLHELDEKELATVRFLTANQDFRGSRDNEDFFQKYIDDDGDFRLSFIAEKPALFLNALGITDLAQNDKREKYAVKAANFLREKEIKAFEIAEYYENDCLKIKKALVNNTGMGYGNKKADMFIRDMYEWNVWPDLKNISEINVASDINTIKVSLRTGILKTKLTPLLSSFLDIFCYQYSTIDDWTAKAWKKVWEIWKDKYPDTAPYGPAYFDYFLYNIIGKNFCKENLFLYKGVECNHKFYYTGRNKRCRKCSDIYNNNKVTFLENDNKIIAKCEKHPEHEYEVDSKRKRKCKICENISINRAVVINRYLPCSRPEGHIALTRSKFITGPNAVLPNITDCPFKTICQPESKTFRKLNPPKSISILGRTGWESAKAIIEEGGGGLMA